MAYRQDNYDPNHLPSGQDMRKQRQLTFALTPVWLLLTMHNLLTDEDGSWAQLVSQIFWVLFIVVILLTLTGKMYRWFGGKRAEEQLHVLEDELAQHHRAISFQWGMIATIVMAVGIYFIAPYGNLDARETAMTLVLTALTVTSLRFALLEKDDGEEG